MKGKPDKFWQLREKMVKEQLEGRDIVDQRVLAAARDTPREQFVPSELKDQAYEDHPLPIGHNQTISQPYIVALMCQLLELKGNEKVLDIGTGSGYQAAILSRLACQVIGLEIIKDLADKAQKKLQQLGYKNVKVINRDGRLGYPDQAPYDGIICAAASTQIPTVWIKQLKEGGRIVMPQKVALGQKLLRATKKNGRIKKEYFGWVAFVPLIR